jgi:replicative DNA helicase
MENKTAHKGELLLKKEEQLYSYEGEDRVVSSHELAAELDKTKESVFRLNTKVPTLDRLLDGIEAGELVIVTGPTGEGKTTLLMSITKNLAEQSIKSCWFTLEVTPRQFLNKLTLMSDQLPLFYLPRQNTENYITWIEDRIIEAKVKYNIHAIFIDHIHQIFSLQRMSNNVSLEIGDLVAKIKDIAIVHNVVIFLIAHSKDQMLVTTEPRKEDIRDSGLISRLADTIIGVWRTTNDDNGQLTSRPKQINEADNRSKVRVFKNRRTGMLGGFVMTHTKHYLTEFDGFITERKDNNINF